MVINTDGKPSARDVDAGAPKTIGLYLMGDVKQFDPRMVSRHRRKPGL
jgi:hypothetical protein